MDAITAPLPAVNTSSSWLKLSTLLGYFAALASIALVWSVRDQNLIRADDGVGYWLGIIGGSLMLLLLIYPMRKRIRVLSGLGSVGFWFRTHMIFGIVGPLLVLFHSNFNLGSLNGRVALFCTLVVASSGILGRYLYGKIHYGMYGQRATLQSLQQELAGDTGDSGGMLGVVELIGERLRPFEQVALGRASKVLPSVFGIVAAPVTTWRLQRALEPEIRAVISDKAMSSALIAQHRERLQAGAERYLENRLATYRKFAQLRGCERLFGLWHIVHFPLFLVMVAAAIVHVFAVHAY